MTDYHKWKNSPVVLQKKLKPMSYELSLYSSLSAYNDVYMYLCYVIVCVLPCCSVQLSSSLDK